MKTQATSVLNKFPTLDATKSGFKVGEIACITAGVNSGHSIIRELQYERIKAYRDKYGKVACYAMIYGSGIPLTIVENP